MQKKLLRHSNILDLVNTRERISVKELAELCGVSELTIRRDVQELEQRGSVQNVRGMVLKDAALGGGSYDLSVESTRNLEVKNEIGRYAASLIEENDIVMIDNGSTTERLAVHFPDDIHATVLCYSINVLNHLYRRPNLSLVFGGGYFHPNSLMFESKEALSLIRRTRARKVFLSATGVHESLGVTCTRFYEAECKRVVRDAGMEKILLADSSKFGKVFDEFICDFTDFDRIVTDRALPELWQHRITEAGIRLDMV